MRVRLTPEFPRLVIADDGTLWGPSGKRLRPFRDKTEYLKFNLYRGQGRWSQHGVHIAVCTAYHGPRPDGQVVRHLDGNPRNNRADNLCWGTGAENEADKILHGTALLGELHPQAKLTASDVRAIRSAPPYYGYRRDLAARYGVSVGTISQIRTGQTWGHL